MPQTVAPVSEEGMPTWMLASIIGVSVGVVGIGLYLIFKDKKEG